MNIFDSLHPAIRAVLIEQGIREPTPPQQLTIPKILQKKNILLIAPTGIGKTEAAILPVFHLFLSNRTEPISILYITPLRALNRDMLKRMSWYSDKLQIKVAVRHADTPKSERLRQAKNPPEFLITTPETLQILLVAKKMQHYLRNVRYVIIDEIHDLADNDRGAQLAVGLEKLNELCAEEFLRIGLSATVGNEKDIANFLKGSAEEVEIVRIPIVKQLDIIVDAPVVEKDDKQLSNELQCDASYIATLRKCSALINNHKSTLLFVNTRDCAELLAARYNLLQLGKIGVHHGSLSAEVRIQMEDDFKNNILKSLICTSSLELGIDIGSADFTIQYNSPRQVTRLLQRVGRAGHRFDLVSKGVILANTFDDLIESCVIARRCLNGWIEDFKIRENPFVVLANQIVTAVLSQPYDVWKLYELFRRTYTFRNLQKEEYLKVVKLLTDLKLVRSEAQLIKKGRFALQYFCDNISMLPDTITYKVVDISSRKTIGTLDESFVATHLTDSKAFVMKGVSWQAVDIGERVIQVTPSKEMGVIPKWVGAEIPVPFEIAQEVGQLRGIIAQNTSSSVIHSYPATENVWQRLVPYLKKQKKFEIPTDTQITIELSKTAKTVVVNCCFGSKVNETLGRLLGALAAAQTGESVGVETDAYRIILEFPTVCKVDTIKNYLFSLEPEGIEKMLRIILKNSSYLRWQFVHCAKKFGILEKKVDYSQIKLDKIIDAYADTIVYEEAIRKVLHEFMDIENTKIVLDKIRKGIIKIVLANKLSPIALAGFEKKMDLIKPDYVDYTALSALRQRLENTHLVTICLHCFKTHTIIPKNVVKNLNCIFCGSQMVAAVKPTEKEVSKFLTHYKKQEKLTKTCLRLMYKNASLVQTYGRNALLALAARGIGADTAARLLCKGYTTEIDFLKAILAAELQYARTKRFWA